jgi:hypothetical protein
MEFYRNVSDFKKVYHSRTNRVKTETGDFFTGSYSILVRWREYFS